MSDHDDNTPKPIVPPDAPPGDRVRTVVSALTQLAPLGGFISALVDDVVPTGAERQRKAWEGDISARTNEHTTQLRAHEALLQPQETLDGATVALVVALANHCPTGLGGTFYEPADLAQLCPEIPEAELADAAYELEGHNLVEIRRFWGGAWHLRLTQRFFEQVDHQVMGWSTDADAVLIASLILEHNQGRAADLHQLTGWPARRFNPPFRKLLVLFPAGRVSREVQARYATSYIALQPEDRVALRRFIKVRAT